MTKPSNNYILRLKKGDEVISSLLSFCQKETIHSAWIWGIGAISEAKLASYMLSEKKYYKKDLKGCLEIASMSGNIGLLDKKIVGHIHVVLSDSDMNAFGGHLDQAIVAATCEIFIKKLEIGIERKYDSDIGLNLIC